jgi:hypothetical protein
MILGPVKGKLSQFAFPCPSIILLALSYDRTTMQKQSSSLPYLPANTPTGSLVVWFQINFLGGINLSSSIPEWFGCIDWLHRLRSSLLEFTATSMATLT